MSILIIEYTKKGNQVHKIKTFKKNVNKCQNVTLKYMHV